MEPTGNADDEEGDDSSEHSEENADHVHDGLNATAGVTGGDLAIVQ